jgi:tetratricopeptide (TPR) repeat protein
VAAAKRSRSSTTTTTTQQPRKHETLKIAVAIWLATFVLFLPSLRCGFTAYDDPDYVTANPHVLGGLTLENVRWALTASAAANWHPLTWVSLMSDASVFGTAPWGYHLTSVLIHASNAALLLVVMTRLTGSLGRSAALAAAFALHPLRVESVTWIAERKDVLSGLFFLLTLLAYGWYVQRPGLARYAAVAATLAAGLMAKPMLVTTPFVLLLLDVWPLKRFKGTASAWRRVIPEKLPLIGLSLAASAVTFLVQKQAGAVAKLEQAYSLPNRIGNAVVACVRYAGKTFWPTDLAVFYPHPGSWPPWELAAATAGLIVASVGALVALRRGRRSPVFVGWFWFVGMLVPVIGIVQVGAQSMADRYTYLPGIGLAMAVIWPVADLAAGRQWARGATAAALAAALVCTCIATWRQQAVWVDTYSLMSHAVDVTRGNYVAHEHLARQLAAREDPEGAARQFAEALRANPRYYEAWYNWGNLLIRQRRPADAADRYREAARLRPAQPDVRLGLGTAYAMLGDLPAAEREYREAIRLRPDWPDALVSLAMAIRNQGRPAEAMPYLLETLRIDPRNQRASRGVAELRAAEVTPAPASTQP